MFMEMQIRSYILKNLYFIIGIILVLTGIFKFSVVTGSSAELNITSILYAYDWVTGMSCLVFSLFCFILNSLELTMKIN